MAEPHARVCSNGTCASGRDLTERRRVHLCELRSRSLWRVICCSRSSKALLMAATGVGADRCTAIWPEGRRRFSDTVAALARRTLLHHALQVQQFGPKDLQPLAQFFHQVMDFFFEIRSLAQLIADVDIHAKPQNTGSGSREALSSLLIGFYTRGEQKSTTSKLRSVTREI